MLYLTGGDHGEQERAQDPGDAAGSVLRLHDDGRIPKDNPHYQGQADWLPALYSIGHRNIQGAALHPQTGELFAHEHGPQGGDEINVIRPALNYGWPTITYGVNYGLGTRIGEGTHKKGMAQPLLYWVPSIAPSGIAFYTADRFPAWQGLWVGALKAQLLVRLSVAFQPQQYSVKEIERIDTSALGRIRDVRQGPDGYLYVLNDSPMVGLWRLSAAK